ncbi:MAG: hypothetical protein JNK04_24145 [Myxococcales bacterium]|nr:hypothetical protein [Myxococcales bacterium]
MRHWLVGMLLPLAACGGRVEPSPISNADTSGDGTLPATPRGVDSPALPSSLASEVPPREPPSAEGPPIPSSLAPVVGRKPYVEERCVPAASPQFPSAQRCKYEVMGIAAEVTIANPTPDRVAEWVVDAAAYVGPLKAIRESHPDAWLRGVTAFMTHIKQQSSRIFPLEGDIVEDLGAGPKRFAFDRGVVTPCDRGNCRCRINSLTVGAYCRYRESRGDDRHACLDRYEGKDGDAAWRDACRDNHARALTQTFNEHFRARAWDVGRRIEERCKAGCKPGEVVARLEKELGIQ